MKLLFFAVVSAAAFMGMVRGQIVGDIPYSDLCGKNPRDEPGGVHWVCFERTQVEQLAFKVHGGHMALDSDDIQHVAVYLKHPDEFFVLTSGSKDVMVAWNDKDGCVSLSGAISGMACKGQLFQI